MAANNRLTIVAEAGEQTLRGVLDGLDAVADYTVEAPAPAPEPAEEPAEPAEEPAPTEEAPVTCKATLTLAGDPAAACRAVFFAFAAAGCALLQMTPVRADLENIFIELTEDEAGQKGGAQA